MLLKILFLSFSFFSVFSEAKIITDYNFEDGAEIIVELKEKVQVFKNALDVMEYSFPPHEMRRKNKKVLFYKYLAKISALNLEAFLLVGDSSVLEAWFANRELVKKYFMTKKEAAVEEEILKQIDALLLSDLQIFTTIITLYEGVIENVEGKGDLDYFIKAYYNELNKLIEELAKLVPNKE